MVTIPKASSVQHLEEDLGAIGWDMDSKDIKKLDEFRLPQ
jgi:diketogulonate reductase-like aldo/keto reductase